MLSIRRRIKKTSRHYSLRKKVNALKKTSNDKRIYVWVEDVKQKNDRYLNVITLFPEGINLPGISNIPLILEDAKN